MASEIFSAREGRVNPVNSVSKARTRIRQAAVDDIFDSLSEGTYNTAEDDRKVNAYIRDNYDSLARRVGYKGRKLKF